MNTLYLERRGCDFFSGDNIAEVSDIGNYRVCTTEDLKFVDGNDYFLEFTRWNKQVWRYHYKNNPDKNLKVPVLDKVIPNLLFIDNQYCNRDESTGRLLIYRNCNLQQEMIDKMYVYTKENILKLVNEYSVVKYDVVKII